MLETQCVEVMDRVRTFFSKGHKSSNKVYHIQHDGSADTSTVSTLNTADHSRFIKRWVHSGESSANRLAPPNGTSDYELAELLVKMPVSDRSGNCGEMAALSAYYAHKHYSVSRSCLYVATISGKGDHVFCLVTTAGITSSPLLSFGSVADFTKAKPAAGWLVIDPWLHVAGKATDYLTAGGKQLDHWGTVGKRVCCTAGASVRGGTNRTASTRPSSARRPSNWRRSDPGGRCRPGTLSPCT